MGLLPLERANGTVDCGKEKNKERPEPPTCSVIGIF